MRPLGASDVLALWESGAHRHPIDRSVLLCAFARAELPVESIADLPLGEVTAALLRLHEENFGARIRCHLDCPGCGERLELTLDSSALLQAGSDASREACDVGGMRLRAPSLRDLAAVAGEHDGDHAARLLLARCVSSPVGLDLGALTQETLRVAEEALEAVDPDADIALDVHCELCGHNAMAQMDAGALLWDELEARARTVLAEVDALARAYGWTESEILSLGAARRATYLSMVAT